MASTLAICRDVKALTAATDGPICSGAVDVEEPLALGSDRSSMRWRRAVAGRYQGAEFVEHHRDIRRWTV